MRLFTIIRVRLFPETTICRTNAWYWKKSSETALLPNYFSLILIYKSREKTKISTQIYGKNRVNNDKYRNSLLTIVFYKKKKNKY